MNNNNKLYVYEKIYVTDNVTHCTNIFFLFDLPNVLMILTL